jgi:rRNA-processing protein FCF1
MTSPSTSYKDTLLAELDQIAAQLTRILDVSSIRPTNLPSNFIGFASHRWEPSNDELTAARMATLRNLRDWEPRFRLLFPHPTPEVAERLEAGFEHLYGWLDRDEDDHSIPATIEAAQTKTAEAIEDLRSLPRLLPDDDWPTRLVVDTNTLLDDPDLTIYATTLGRRYIVHVLPVVLRELDELKRAGRIPEIRDAARKADRRLKGLRDNGNVRVGARVAGEIYAVFEHTEPGGDGLPGWLDLTVPDDRLVASVLLLQSVHPGSMVHVATSDLNLQTKLAAVGLPHLEPPG